MIGVQGMPMREQRSRICPKCGHDLKIISSGDTLIMRFLFCSNPECDYIESQPVFSTHHKLPVPYEDVLVVLKNERKEAQKNTAVIGKGSLISIRQSRDRSVIVTDVKVKFSKGYEDYRLRPYDSIYYGGIIGVVAEQRSNTLSILFDSSKNPPKIGEIQIAEPVILYDSAISILEERASKDGAHITRFINIPNITSPTIGKILGYSDLSAYSLDEEKRRVVEDILQMPEWDYRVIEGPPGTGKTTAIAAAACEAASHGLRVLITSHTNVAVDNALERIITMRPDLKEAIMRIGHPAKVSQKIRPFIDKPQKGEGRREWIKRILSSKRIIGMTIAKLAVLDLIYKLDEISKEMNSWPTFDYAFIDEASTVPLALITTPAYYSKRWIILGDTRQLPPIVKTPHKLVGAWSLMEVAVGTGGGKIHMLHIQRRGNKEIFDAISKLFYQGKLRHHEMISQSRLNVKVKATNWLNEALNPAKPLVWIDIKSGVMDWCTVWRGRRRSASAINVLEAAATVKTYLELISGGIRGSDIAIITTYRAQSDLIRKTIKALKKEEKPIVAALYEGETKEECIPEEVENILDLRVAETVDSYQGREKQVILYSITASHIHKALQDYRRANVAFTRAKSKLIVFSSLTSLKKLPWLKYLKLKAYKINVRELQLKPELDITEEIARKYFRK